MNRRKMLKAVGATGGLATLSTAAGSESNNRRPPEVPNRGTGDHSQTIELEPGESTQVTFEVDSSELACPGDSETWMLTAETVPEASTRLYSFEMGAVDIGYPEWPPQWYWDWMCTE